MTKRDRILHLAAEGELADSYVPSAFFLHFPEEAHAGRAAVETHVEYFRATGNDLVKVQYEHTYPLLDSIRRSHDWTNMPCYGEEFYADQLDVVAGVVQELGGEAVVIVTLYSPFMFAQQTVTREGLIRQFHDDPAAVRKGLDVIVRSMGVFIDGCLDRGADGFYVSTQGGEAGTLPDGVFDEWVLPTDLAVWELIGDRARVNVLHVCDYEAPYASFDRYARYPGDIVSAPTELLAAQREVAAQEAGASAGESGGTTRAAAATGGLGRAGRRAVTGREIAELFGRPFLGGMERLGVISKGPADAVRAAARGALEAGPRAMVLGADCTLAASTNWNNIAAATETAHGWKSE